MHRAAAHGPISGRDDADRVGAQYVANPPVLAVRSIRLLSFLSLSLLSLPAQSPSTRPVAEAAAPPALRLFPLRDGLRGDAPDRDASRIGETVVAKEAAKVGIDLTEPEHELLAAGCANGRLFYVFYKVVEEAFGDRAWLLQRIEKTERTWAAPDAEPETKTTFQVEAFKTMAGSLKGPDQHFGSFGLGGAHKREITKVYEIGFGDVPGRAEGAAWPFAADTLFHMLQPYGDERELHDAVRFTNARRWALTVTFDERGRWSVRSEELDIDVPKRKLPSSAGRPAIDPASKALVLEPGVGPKGVEVGVSSVAQVTELLGPPLEDVPTAGGSRNLSYRGGLTCNFDAQGVLNTVIARASFGGRTTQGITHGMRREVVKRKLGAPARGDEDAAVWGYPGLVVTFGADGEVVRLVVTKR